MCLDYSSGPCTAQWGVGHGRGGRTGGVRSPAQITVLGHAVGRMTSRTTPVGILVIALAGLIAMGCSAPTTAVFQALLDPAGTAVSSPEADPASAVVGSDTSTWWQHPDGYEMVLPAGWSGVAVDAAETEALIQAVDEANPGMGDRIEDVVDGSDMRVSAIATSGEVAGKVAPVMLVLAEPKAGRKPFAIKEDVKQRIGDLPGLNGRLAPHEVQLPHATGVRYDYTIMDEDLGEVSVRSWLFRYGRWVYLVNFFASADLADDAAGDFDEIQDSLSIGF